MVEVFRALKEIDRQERWDSQKANLEILRGSGFLKRGKMNDDHTLVLREEGRHKVDFYLTRNKWWDHDKRRCRYGDAVAFINWYLSSQYGVYKFEIGIENVDGETNTDGSFSNYADALDAVGDVIEEYDKDDDIVAVFIDAWVMRDNLPYPVGGDLFTYRYEGVNNG